MPTSTPNTSNPAAPATTPAPLGRPLDTCPSCGSWQLRAVADTATARVHFLCGSCDRCWHVELGYVRRVLPDRCGGCPQPGRCHAVYAQDHISG